MSGKMIPPTLPPVVASPVAAARLRKKKWAMEDIAGVNMSAVPKPPAIENDKMKCHSSVTLHLSMGNLQSG